MSRDDIEALRADVVSAHRLIELMGEEKEALGERVDALERAGLVWSQKVDDGELDAQPEFKALQERMEALEEWSDVLLREFNDKGILSDGIIYKMSQWVKDRLAMKRGKPPAEVPGDLTAAEEPEKSEADQGIEMLWPEEGGSL